MAADLYDAWRRDAEVLASIGRDVAPRHLRCRVMIPPDLAMQAVAAWERDDVSDPPLAESLQQWQVRHAAAALALIGLAITERGTWSASGVEVDLAVELLGAALDATDIVGDVSAPNEG